MSRVGNTTTQFQRPRVFLWSADAPGTRVDLSEDVISFSYNKALTDASGFYAASGGFTLTVMPRTLPDTGAASTFDRCALAYGAAHPQTVISIGYDEPGGIMLGLVDSVTESWQLAGAAVQRSVTITGRDLGKVLEIDHIVRAPITTASEPQFVDDIKQEFGERFPIINDSLKLYQSENSGVVTFLLESIPTLLDWILDRLPGMRIPVLRDAFGGGVEGFDQVRTWLDTSRSVTTWDDERVYREAREVPEGSIMSFIQSILDPDFYELWVDFQTLEGSPIPQPMLVLRPRPFDEEPYIIPLAEQTGIGWTDLDLFVVDQSEVMAARFSRSDAQAQTFYQVQNANELGAGDSAIEQGLIFPLADTWAMKRHGLRCYSPRLALVNGDPTFAEKRRNGKFEQALVPTLIEKRNRLFNWYRWNPWYESAQVTVYGRDAFRIGQRVSLPWRADYLTGTPGMEYYVSGVTYRWTDAGGYFCDLQLTRGHNGAMLTALLDRVARESGLPGGFTKVDA